MSLYDRILLQIEGFRGIVLSLPLFRQFSIDEKTGRIGLDKLPAKFVRFFVSRNGRWKEQVL